MADRNEKVKAEIIRRAATLLVHESNHDALISVTDCELSPDLKNAIIMLSVLPDTKSVQALDFANRHAKQLRETIAADLKLHHVPFIKFEIDRGEENRKRIDQLLHQN